MLRLVYHVKKNKLHYSFSMGLLLVHLKVDFIHLIGSQDHQGHQVLQHLLHLLKIEGKDLHSEIDNVHLLRCL